jgi:hypothetical protein
MYVLALIVHNSGSRGVPELLVRLSYRDEASILMFGEKADT